MSLQKCYEYAMNYIYRYPKTEKELKVQLTKKGFSESDIEEAVNMLKKKKFVDDKNFADAYINSELVKKGKPVAVIKAKLMQKGVDKHLIDDIITGSEEEVKVGIHDQIKKEIRKYKSKGMEGFDIIQRLVRKGYRVDDIKKAIDSV